MTLSDLGNIGDFIGAIGVIVSLIYLAIQIRQNTKSVRNSTYQEIVRDMTASTDLLASNSELARAWRMGLQDFGALDADQRVRFGAYMLSLFRRLENILHQSNYGTLDPASWEGWRAALRNIVRQPGVVVWWHTAHTLFSRDFREYVGRELESLKEDAD